MRINLNSPSFKSYYNLKNDKENIEVSQEKYKSNLSYISNDSKKDLITYIKPVPKKSIELLEGQFLDDDNQVFNRGTTEFARPDIDWREFRTYLQDRFKNQDRVNVYNWACSTGEESYTLAMLLKSAFDDSDKFFPINAADIDKDRVYSNIIRQKFGTPVEYSTCFKLRSALHLKDDDFIGFFKLKDKIIYIDDEILNSVNFRFSNILTDLDVIDSDVPALIMARNMWLYVDPSKYDDFAQKLYDKLASGSTIVIGIHDCLGERGIENSFCFPDALKKAGFVPKNVAQSIAFSSFGKDMPIIYEK